MDGSQNPELELRELRAFLLEERKQNQNWHRYQAAHEQYTATGLFALGLGVTMLVDGLSQVDFSVASGFMLSLGPTFGGVIVLWMGLTLFSGFSSFRSHFAHRPEELQSLIDFLEGESKKPGYKPFPSVARWTRLEGHRQELATLFRKIRRFYSGILLVLSALVLAAAWNLLRSTPYV